jgi:hypothetical protein
VVRETDFYSMYFSKGVELEAQLMASRIREDAATGKPGRIVQIFRAGDAGEAGAKALASALATDRLEITGRPLGAGADALTHAIRATSTTDILVLWLRPDDLRQLPADPHAAAAVYFSGLLGGLESAPLPAPWRKASRMTYPVDLPEGRRFRLNFPLGWFRIRHIPIVAEQVQADTYLACGIVSELLNDMLESFYRDYLLERIESMLSRRALTGYYPRLSLAPAQRFASKGGYLVHFTEAEGPRIAADTEWLVP